MEKGQWVRHSVGRSKPTDAMIVNITPEGLLIVQTPGEGFGKFVPPDEATLIDPVFEP